MAFRHVPRLLKLADPVILSTSAITMMQIIDVRRHLIWQFTLLFFVVFPLDKFQSMSLVTLVLPSMIKILLMGDLAPEKKA